MSVGRADVGRECMINLESDDFYKRLHYHNMYTLRAGLKVEEH